MKKILLFLAAITLSHAQDIYTTGTPANGVNVTTADLIQFRDVSVTSGAGKVRPLAIGELVNVPGFFSSVPNGTFSLAKISQSGATTGQVPKWNGSAWAPAADDAGSAVSAVQNYEDFTRLPSAFISSSSVANPTVITTTAPHKFTTGQQVTIHGHTSTPSLAGQHTVTVLSATTFSVPVNVTAGGGASGTAGVMIAPGSSPQIGAAWRMHRNIQGSAFGSENPFTTPYGMRSAREVLLYMGNVHPEPITSLSFYLNWRASVTPGAVPRNQLTIAVSASPLLIDGGDNILLPPRMLHMSITRNQLPSVGLGTGAGGAVWTAPTSTRVIYSGENASSVPMGLPLNVDGLIRVELETGEMRVYVPGAVCIYNDTRFNADLIGQHWWMEFAGDRYNGSDYNEVPHVERLWINAPSLDATPGIGAQPRSAVLDRLSSDGLIPFSSPLALAGAVTHTASYLSTVENGIKGTPTTGYGARSPAYGLETKTSADNLSTAGMVYTAGSLLTMGGRPLVAGTVNTYELSGYFADTANDRRIAINESVTTGDVFDSGPLAAADVRNKCWTLRLTIQRTGTSQKRFFTEFKVDGLPVMIRTKTGTSAAAGNIFLRCDSVAAGDVQVFSYFSTHQFL